MKGDILDLEVLTWNICLPQPAFIHKMEQPDSLKALVRDLDLAQVTLSLALRASRVQSSHPGNLGALLPPPSRIGRKTPSYMGSGGVVERRRGGAAVARALREVKTRGAPAKVARTGATKT